jgi:TRAP-type mannitol/chloroaromatic compound transport system permease small subunit
MKIYKEKKQNVLKLIGLIIFAPFIGLFYFLSLPIVTICMILFTIGNKTCKSLKNFIATMISFEWQPKIAYLEGKKNKKNQRR